MLRRRKRSVAGEGVVFWWVQPPNPYRKLRRGTIAISKQYSSGRIQGRVDHLLVRMLYWAVESWDFSVSNMPPTAKIRFLIKAVPKYRLPVSISYFWVSYPVLKLTFKHEVGIS